MNPIDVIEFGDCRDIMRRWASQGVKVQTCITSPPYYGLRDYGVAGQIGLEATPDAYVAALVEVFRCVRDVLADDGTLWLNLGDSYAQTTVRHRRHLYEPGYGGGGNGGFGVGHQSADEFIDNSFSTVGSGLKPKDLIGIPWRVALALQADGWYLRSDIIWHKPNPMPESVRDRPTKSHEYLFLLARSERYHYDADAIKEPATYAGQSRGGSTNRYEQNAAGMDCKVFDTRNRRSVWTVQPRPYKGCHFATFPPELITPCILAGCPEGGSVLDPFMGSGTTAMVARSLRRRYLGCELNPEYESLQKERIYGTAIEPDDEQPFLFNPEEYSL